MLAQLYQSSQSLSLFEGDVVSEAGPLLASLAIDRRAKDAKKAANVALVAMKLCKTSRWLRTDWGWQCNVDFNR